MQIRRLIVHDAGPFAHLDMSFPEGKVEGRADVHLLVGPNGTGKSTVLSAIAQCFSFGVETGLGPRLRSLESYVAVGTTLGWRGIRPDRGRSRLGPIDAPPDAVLDAATDLKNSWLRDNLYLAFGSPLHAPLVQAQQNPPGRSVRPPAVPFALFAYGGLRSVSDSVVSGVQDLTDNPHHGATTFHRAEGTRPLLQWMNNTVAKQALSVMKGATGRASASAAALDRLRDAISFVTGAEVRFELVEDTLTMQVSMGGGPLVPIDQLPDGLKSLLSWLGDLLMRLDRMPWSTPEPITDRRFVLLLDEVEVHLHPAWQRRVIPMVERLFPNAQIIASTHSPFVIGSATDAWIHAFRLEGANAVVDPPQPSARGTSYPAILESIMGVDQEFDVDSEADLTRFRELWHARLKGDKTADAPLESLRLALGQRSEELGVIVETELRDLRRRLQRAGGDAA